MENLSPHELKEFLEWKRRKENADGRDIKGQSGPTDGAQGRRGEGSQRLSPGNQPPPPNSNPAVRGISDVEDAFEAHSDEEFSEPDVVPSFLARTAGPSQREEAAPPLNPLEDAKVGGDDFVQLRHGSAEHSAPVLTAPALRIHDDDEALRRREKQYFAVGGGDIVEDYVQPPSNVRNTSGGVDGRLDSEPWHREPQDKRISHFYGAESDRGLHPPGIWSCEGSSGRFGGGSNRASSVAGVPHPELFRGGSSGNPGDDSGWGARKWRPVILTVMGILTFIFIVVMIFGAVNLGNYNRDYDDVKRFKDWSERTTCEVVSWQRRGINCGSTPATNTSCCFFVILTVKVGAWENELTNAFSNFDDGVCGGRLNWSVGERFDCYIRPSMSEAASSSTNRKVLLERPEFPSKSDKRTAEAHLIAGGVLLALTVLFGFVAFAMTT